jgi:energy-coupling factor transporter ATP-binding protein EcfA2
LREVSFFQKPGEAIGVVGCSGAGRSSLIRCLNRIIPQFFPGDFQGEIRLFGKSIRGLRPFELADRVGVVLQDFESQLFSSQAELDVAFGPENLGLGREEIKRRVSEALARVGMLNYRERDPSTLSGGQKQRLAIATVLALHPRILALDEATTDLDPVGRGEIVSIIRELVGQGGISLVLVEHEPEELRVVDRIVILKQGRVERDGPVEEILGDVEGLEAAGVKPPDAAKVFSEMGFSERPIRVEQAVELLQKAGTRFSEPGIQRLMVLDQEARDRAGGPILEVEGLTHSYPGGTEALKGVDLQVREREFLAVVGQNGSGKTTLVKHLNGLLQPTRGEVFFQGRSIKGSSVSELGQEIGFVFQNPDHQIFSSSVEEEIAFGPRNHGFSESAIKDRVARALELVGLAGFEGSDPFIMTRGERQRVAVASILAMDPRVIILDEPTTGLDYTEQVAVMEMLAELNRKGHTIIIITHTLWLVARYAHRAVLMAEGRIIAHGGTREVLAQRETLARASLKLPEIIEIGEAFGFPTLSVQEFTGLAKEPA